MKPSFKIGDKISITRRKYRYLIRDMYVYLTPNTKEFSIQFANEVFCILGAYLHENEPLTGTIIAPAARENDTQYYVVRVGNKFGLIDNIVIEDKYIRKLSGRNQECDI